MAEHHGADRDVERRRDLRVAQLLDVAQDDSLPQDLGQRPPSARSRSSRPEASASWGGGVGRPLTVELHRLRAALRPAERVGPDALQDRVQPRPRIGPRAGSGRRPGTRAGRSPAPGPRRRGRSPSFGKPPRRGAAGVKRLPRIARRGSNRAVPRRAPPPRGTPPPGLRLFRSRDSDTDRALDRRRIRRVFGGPP